MIVYRNTNRKIFTKTFKHIDKYLWVFPITKKMYLTLVIFYKETFYFIHSRELKVQRL